MRRKKRELPDEASQLTDEMREFLEREQEKNKNNKIKNRPILLMTYIMVFVFLFMAGNIVYYVYNNTEKIVANAANKRQNSFAKYVVRGKIVAEDHTVLAETTVDEEGNETRYYPYGSLFAHTVGYNNYGKSGIELDYNFDMMRSHVQVTGKVMNDLKNNKNPGDVVVTTLDYNLQSAAANALSGAQGAVVVLDASTSDILCMYSNPTFDPNDMDNVWNSIHSEEGSSSTVLLNRATQGLYAPGSTFKVITAMEYIKEHPDYESYYHNCTGTDIFNSVSIRCSNSVAHGELDLKMSLARSCNTSFANIGTNEIDMDSMHSFCEKLLYNSKLPYDGEYSKSVFKLDGSSDIYAIPQTVIGQGDTLVTPLHNALIMQAIANGGLMMRPRLVSCIENADEKVYRRFNPKSYGQVIEPEITKAVIPMLEEVCVSGTASSYMADKPYTVAGKTGTAEYDNNGNCNSWFVGFSNVEKPDIVISVVVEDYTSNQISGTSVASQVFDAYYNGNNE